MPDWLNFTAVNRSAGTQTENQPGKALQPTVLGRYVKQGKASIGWRKVAAGDTGVGVERGAAVSTLRATLASGREHSLLARIRVPKRQSCSVSRCFPL